MNEGLGELRCRRHFLVTATLFETEIAVTNFRVLFAFDNSVGTLYQKRFDIASGFGNPDRFFLPCTFIVGRR